MPTSRHRYTITETDEVARALKLAAERWPEQRDHGGQLLHRVLEDWARSASTKRDRHRVAILATSGSAFPREFEAGYRDDLRADWPE